MAIQASLTGHLVFSTVHTNDAAGAITRLVDMGIEPFLVASSLVGLLAQRLVRRLCPECRVLYRPTDEELRKLEHRSRRRSSRARCAMPPLRSKYTPPPHGHALSARATAAARAAPRPATSGRMGIYELLLMDNEIRQLALKNTDSEYHQAGRDRARACARCATTARPRCWRA